LSGQIAFDLSSSSDRHDGWIRHRRDQCSEVSPADGKAVLGNGEQHLRVICNSLVGLMLDGASCGDFDLGTEVDPEEFGEAVRTHRPQLVGLRRS